ncbi:MAG: hypothetical protein ACM3QZ_00145 [Solirubrobacterales bacterium]
MDSYLLNQVNDVFIENWNKYFSKDIRTKEELVEDLRKQPPTRMIEPNLDLSDKGNLCFFTSGTSGQETFFQMKPESLFGKYAFGLGQMYEELFNVTNHNLRSAILAFPLTGSPLGLKHLFALLDLGVDVYPGGNRNFDFTPQNVVNLVDKREIEMIISRPLEVEVYSRLANKWNLDMSSVMAILLTGEVVGQRRLQQLSEAFPNAEIKSVYGLTEINAGLFACECGNYHFRNNGQTLVDLVERENSIYSNIYYSVIRPELTAIRYNTRDVGRLIENCPCHQGGHAMNVKGRDSDEVAKDFFLMDVSEKLFEHGYEHNLFADITQDGQYHIIIKSSAFVDKSLLNELQSQLPHVVLSNYLFGNEDNYVPRTKSCTLHRGVGKYEIPNH